MRWIWLVVLCACGDNVIPRLVALTYEVGDVTYTRPGEFHDTLRDEDCRPWGWADGATYCTPAYRDVVYADSACTDALAPPTAQYTPTYFTLDGLTYLRRLRPVTPSTRTPSQYWARSGDTCSGPYPVPAGTQFGEIGDELDESAFVRLLRSAPEGDGRLQTIAWHTSDGLHQPMGFHDRDLGVDCTVTADFGRDRDEVACMPPAPPIFDYSDAACTHPVVVASDPVPFVQVGCGMIARIGSEQTTPIFERNGGICAPATLPPGCACSASARRSTCRCSRACGRAPVACSRSRSCLAPCACPTVFLHDTQLDADCVPAPSTDIARCMPPYVNLETFYHDDICSQPVPIAREVVGACDAPVRYAYDPDGWHVVGAVDPGPFYVPSTGDTCMQVAAPGEPHDVGPALPADTFVPAL